MDFYSKSLVSLDNTNKFWVLDGKMICETPAGSPLSEEHQDFMIRLYSQNKGFRLFSIDSHKTLLCGINANINSFAERQSMLRDIADFIPGCVWKEGDSTLLYKNQKIGCKKFTNEKAVELTEKLNGYIAFNNPSILSKGKDNGEISEHIFESLINDWFLCHPSIVNHDASILLLDGRGNGLKTENMKNAEHIGHRKGISDVIFRTNGTKDVYISQKNSNAEEWTSSTQILNGPEVEFFKEAVFKTNLIRETGLHMSKDGSTNPNCVDAEIAEDVSGFTTTMSEELMKRVIFGIENNFCDAVVIQTFTNGYQNEKCIIQEVEDTNECLGIFAVTRLILSIKDVINTKYEPRLLIRRKSKSSIQFNGKTYYGIALCAVFESRINNNTKKIIEFEPWKAEK